MGIKNSNPTDFASIENQIRQTLLPDGQANHPHAWRGAWNRPLYIDENSQHPFTIARMTDHNVKGRD
jgi:hypothetical protein